MKHSLETIAIVLSKSSSVKAAAVALDVAYDDLYDFLKNSDIKHEPGEKWNEAALCWLTAYPQFQYSFAF